MNEEVLAWVGFFLLMGLLVSRIVRVEREQAACADRSGLRGATSGGNELRFFSETSQDRAPSSSSPTADNGSAYTLPEDRAVNPAGVQPSRLNRVLMNSSALKTPES